MIKERTKTNLFQSFICRFGLMWNTHTHTHTLTSIYTNIGKYIGLFKIISIKCLYRIISNRVQQGKKTVGQCKWTANWMSIDLAVWIDLRELRVFVYWRWKVNGKHSLVNNNHHQFVQFQEQIIFIVIGDSNNRNCLKWMYRTNEQCTCVCVCAKCKVKIITNGPNNPDSNTNRSRDEQPGKKSKN